MSRIKELLKKTFIYSIMIKYHENRNQKEVLENWIKEGKPIPPPHIVKYETIKKYKKKFKPSILIETGTYKGAMIISCKKLFKKIYSIELDKDLYENAKSFFKPYQHITIINGDSGEKILNLLTEINEPCVFWLDAHYSGGITAKAEIDTPIMAELDAIFNHNILNHVILIDDARLFNGENDYPTINGLTQYVKSKDKSKTVSIKNDIIIVK